MARNRTEQGDDQNPEVAVVKKYANRRLYNTATSSYVTLDELSQMVRAGHEFVVYDAKTGDDITRSVLTQIILEEDSKGRNLLPIGFLRQVISYYDDSLHALLPRYLELSMENFARHQDQIRDYMEDTFGRFFPLKQLEKMNPFEDIARQNMAMFQSAARMFTPFPGQKTEAGESAAPQARPDKPAKAGKQAESAAANPINDEMRALKEQMEALQQQLAALRKDDEKS